MARYFPLFGRSVHDPEALDYIIKRHQLHEIRNDSLGLSVRTSGCLKKANIETFDEVLMMYPFELLRLPNLGIKSVEELQEKAEQLLHIKDTALPGMGPSLYEGVVRQILSTGSHTPNSADLLAPFRWEGGVISCFCEGCGCLAKLNKHEAEDLAGQVNIVLPASLEGLYFHTKNCPLCDRVKTFNLGRTMFYCHRKNYIFCNVQNLSVELRKIPEQGKD